MKGLENAHILRPGYAIEYDYFDPRSLKSSFETRQIGGLFLRDKSTVQRVTKKRPRRACLLASMRRFNVDPCLVLAMTWAALGCPAATKLI